MTLSCRRLRSRSGRGRRRQNRFLHLWLAGVADWLWLRNFSFPLLSNRPVDVEVRHRIRDTIILLGCTRDTHLTCCRRRRRGRRSLSTSPQYEDHRQRYQATRPRHRVPKNPSSLTLPTPHAFSPRPRTLLLLLWSTVLQQYHIDSAPSAIRRPTGTSTCRPGDGDAGKVCQGSMSLVGLHGSSVFRGVLANFQRTLAALRLSTHPVPDR